jgi:hypothetical protein
MRAALVFALLLQGWNPALAQNPMPESPALDGAAFDALTRGRRFDTFGPWDLYGIEEFLPGQRSVWKDALGCKAGRWKEENGQICFYYEGRPDVPVCWVYKQKADAIWGWYQGDPAGATVRLVPGNSAMECNYLGM